MIVDKAWFQHDMAYGDLKDLTRKTAYDKILCDKAFNISKNPKYDGYLRGLALIVYECFTKKKENSGKRTNKFAGSDIKIENISRKELAEALHKSVIKKSKKKYTEL